MSLIERLNTQDMQFTGNVTLRRVRVNIVAVQKAISSTHSEFVSEVVVIQHAESMRHIVICGLSGFTVFFHIIS
jgi:hypothetical protein